MEKSFIITVDTESDNQWDYAHNQSTKNALYIPRFQEMCEKYGFKPVYLIDYSMANDSFLVEYLKGKLESNKCEVGMHLHAWDTPPKCKIDFIKSVRPYLIEYQLEEMEKKISVITNILKNNFQTPILSHRAGRWATNSDYMKLLEKYGYKIDCSVTPGVNWKRHQGYKIGGSDYSNESTKIHYIPGTNILEVPMTIKKLRMNFTLKNISFTRIIKCLIKRHVWLRPSISNIESIKKLVNIAVKNDDDYLEFMMHSSEFMPGCSPYYETDQDIETLYQELEEIFSYIKKNGYIGKTLQEILADYSKG